MRFLINVLCGRKAVIKYMKDLCNPLVYILAIQCGRLKATPRTSSGLRGLGTQKESLCVTGYFESI